ncbi:MAG: PAS domain S-box protein [Thermodesulfobacteriota bacterium]|nr:PAS domain S-box protein [Thermodesulfobacteriota bacterium]
MLTPLLRLSMGIRAKLIAIFVLIKIVPLLLLVVLLWYQLDHYSDNIDSQQAAIVNEMEQTISLVGSMAVDDAVMALDASARESIERLTNDTAHSVANFLYTRDADIRLAAILPQTETNFKKFLAAHHKAVTYHSAWRQRADQTGWEPVNNKHADAADKISSPLNDNSKDFHHYNPCNSGENIIEKPIYLEMTAVDLNGVETLKVVAGEGTATLSDISDGANTYIKAEDYFAELQKLKPGEIYVSNVIGAYVGSKIIGTYTPGAAKKRNIKYAPQQAGYAGKENPVGRRFQGIVRWATPVIKDGEINGYVTLALDHTHIMEFTDHIVPTKERYSSISDASTGNYAFMWDDKGRNISHPRDYFISGYDPDTGEPVVPWLEDKLYEEWQTSGKPIGEFLNTAPVFRDQGHDKKPAKQLMATGTVGLDGRFLNFAPQCTGWMNLTQHGGSGSFVIFWSGLWKLTTAATIPYFTGQYGDSARGFGFVTIGANVDEFHQAAVNSKDRLNEIIATQLDNVAEQKQQLNLSTSSMLARVYSNVTIATITMIAIIIFIAIWMASYLTKRITEIILGIKHFEQGNMAYRLSLNSNDEMGQLSASFNSMASTIESAFHDLKLSAEEIDAQNTSNKLLMGEMANEITQRVNAEEELAVSELYFRRLIENVSDIIIIVDERGFINYISPSIKRLYGATPEQLVGQHVGSLVHRDDLRNESLAVLCEYHGASNPLEYRLTDHQQQVHVMEVFIQEFEHDDEGGDEEGGGQYILSARDVTQRKLTEEDNRKLSKVVEQNPSSVLVTDTAGRIEYVNPYFEQITGYTFAEVKGKNPRFLNAGKTPKAVFEDLWRTIAAGGVWQGEFINKKKNGELYDENVLIIPMKDMHGKITHYAAIKENTTELKRARFRAEQANRAKSQFLSQMSHELRTPLNAINGFSQLMLKSKKNPLNDKQKNMVEQIGSAGKHLLSLINKVLDLAKIEAGKLALSLEVVEPCSIVMESLSLVSNLAEEYQVTINHSCDGVVCPVVLADFTRVKQVLVNLLSNAIKYNKRGGTVTIEIKPDGSDQLRFIVRDTGLGIAEDRQQKLFVPFARLSENSEVIEGTGIGMTITKQLVEAMGGTIGFESELGEGSTFWFTLPRSL